MNNNMFCMAGYLFPMIRYYKERCNEDLSTEILLHP